MKHIEDLKRGDMRIVHRSTATDTNLGSLGWIFDSHARPPTIWGCPELGHDEVASCGSLREAMATNPG